MKSIAFALVLAMAGTLVYIVALAISGTWETIAYNRIIKRRLKGRK